MAWFCNKKFQKVDCWKTCYIYILLYNPWQDIDNQDKIYWQIILSWRRVDSDRRHQRYKSLEQICHDKARPIIHKLHSIFFSLDFLEKNQRYQLMPLSSMNQTEKVLVTHLFDNMLCVFNTGIVSEKAANVSNKR